jgi:anti-anti-sigma factor
VQIQENETENGILFGIRGSLSGTQKSTIQLFEKVSGKLDTDTKGIVIDLKEVSFIDSMSIGLLVGIILKAKEKGILLRFQNIPSHISSIFESTQLKKIFPELY